MDMAFRFNLIDQPWLPVQRLDGLCVAASLREVLVSAQDFRELGDASPLSTAALHRLLLAVLHRVFGPANEAAWAELWGWGRFEESALDGYLERWRIRFDIFDPDRPFFQVPTLSELQPVPVAKLAHARASGNNATLFDHSLDERPEPVSSAAAARLLVAHQAFALGGLVSYQAGEPPALFKSADAAPLVRCAVTLLRGRTLFETLMLNLVRYSPADGLPEPTTEKDQPAWESERLPSGLDREPDGYVDYLTWQSRRVRLLPERVGNQVFVRHVVSMKGDQFPDAGVTIPRYEQMVAFRRSSPTSGLAWQPVGLAADRLAWRDSDAIFGLDRSNQRRPATFNWTASLYSSYMPDRRVLDLEVLGLVADRAKFELWRRERLPLPAAVIESESPRDWVKLALQNASGCAEAIRRFDWRLAEVLLAPAAEHTERRAQRKDIARLTGSFHTADRYWAQLEHPFSEFLASLVNESPEAAFGRWAQCTRLAAQIAVQEVEASLGESARSRKAAVRALEAYRSVRPTGVVK